MSKRKGMSATDKRRVILKIYHDKKEPLNLKEMEKEATKLGVVEQTIKDMNQSLVDDFEVLSDKIGGGNFYWSFPSKVYQDRKNDEENVTMKITRSREKVLEYHDMISQQKVLRCANGREEKVIRFRELLGQEKELDVTLLAGRANDPAEVNRILMAAKSNMAHANRWTDNMFTVKEYLTSGKGMSSKEADKMLKIDSKFDTLTYDDLPKEGQKKDDDSPVQLKVEKYRSFYC